MTESSQAGGELTAFEAWAKKRGNRLDKFGSALGIWSYEDDETQAAFVAWLARATLSAPPAKWCAHCRKDTHSDNECWSTRAIGVHDAHPAPMQMPTAFAWPKDIAAQATPVAAVAQPVAEDDPYYNLLGVIADAKAGNFNSVCVETLERVAAALAASPSCGRQDVGGGK